MKEINIILQTADRTKKAEVAVLPSLAIQDLLDDAIKNWNLPSDSNTVYAIHNESQGGALVPVNGTIEGANVSAGDRLAVSSQAQGGAYA